MVLRSVESMTVVNVAPVGAESMNLVVLKVVRKSYVEISEA